MEEQADDTSVSTVATYEGLEMLAVTLNRICTTCVFGKQGRPNPCCGKLTFLTSRKHPSISYNGKELEVDECATNGCARAIFHRNLLKKGNSLESGYG